VPSLYVSYWHGLWAPKGTPKDIIARLNAAVVNALADPAVRQRLADIGQEVWPREQQTPEALLRTTRPRPRNGGRSSGRRTLKAGVISTESRR